ncbi:Cuticle-degrading serine protease isoform X2 [Oopsacas minuta]|uniref:Cuticle-degrading serine protease isoform X2 n=1 Tax=Oopsacas minuta TaxID=111878 RepID=A0AAV7JCA5_9METZ|nr:Cuticle-degrading serine protease isoform X2 [Oopsacas minuta]
MLKIFVCLLLFTIVTARSLRNNNKYIIVLRDGCGEGDMKYVMNEIQLYEGKQTEDLEMKCSKIIFPFITAVLSDNTVHKVSLLPVVDYIEKDQRVHMSPMENTTTSKGPTFAGPTDGLQLSTDRYNLDIINKPTDGCRNNEYDPPNDGTGADIYIIDTGINYDHADFKDSHGVTRAKYGGYDPIIPSKDGADCNGHGSHCAGIAGGITSGVAKNANLYSIRVLDCSGSGWTSEIIGGLDHVAGRHEERHQDADFVASIASMSLGGGYSNAFNKAVNDVVGKGVFVVSASGNDGLDACNSSPGSATDSINVGASSEPIPGCENPIAYFSNWGTCVDIIAPGVDIMSVDFSNNNDFTKFSGTSMACPHVAGAVALLLKNDKTLTPAEVKEMISNGADDVDRSAMTPHIRNQSTSKRLYVPTNYS